MTWVLGAKTTKTGSRGRLGGTALDAGGTDNITVIVADMPLTEPEHHAFSAFKLDEGEDIGAIEDATLQTLRTIRSA